MSIPRSTRWIVRVTLLALGLISWSFAEPPKHPRPPLHGRPFPPEEELKASLKPLPPLEIPDDPPPHEGALIDVPYIVEPPDLIMVEVLEALPGRPISGERLVRPDGMIHLGFYGEVHVRGLTLEQIKTKIILHLRGFLVDPVLGVVSPDVQFGPLEEPLPPELRDERPEAARQPQQDFSPPSDRKPFSIPGSPPPAPPAESVRSQPLPRQPRQTIAPGGGEEDRSSKPRSPTEPKRGSNEEKGDRENREGSPFVMPDLSSQLGEKLISIHPADSDRVFVDMTAYNSKVYFVQGDVQAPGKLPCMGHETVLDALNYAGGLIPTADPKNIRLVRPSRGGKPAKIYPVDLEAIREKGDSKANFQIFPGDRLIVGRTELAKKSIEINQLAAPLQTVINSMLQYSFAVRSVAQATSSPTPGGPALTPEQRDQIMKDWVDFWWKAASKSGGVELDEKTFREALLRHLNPPQGPPEEKEKK